MCAAGIDGYGCIGIVQRVVSTQVEQTLVLQTNEEWRVGSSEDNHCTFGGSAGGRGRYRMERGGDGDIAEHRAGDVVGAFVAFIIGSLCPLHDIGFAGLDAGQVVTEIECQNACGAVESRRGFLSAWYKTMYKYPLSALWLPPSR